MFFNPLYGLTITGLTNVSKGAGEGKCICEKALKDDAVKYMASYVMGRMQEMLSDKTEYFYISTLNLEISREDFVDNQNEVKCLLYNSILRFLWDTDVYKVMSIIESDEETGNMVTELKGYWTVSKTAYKYENLTYFDVNSFEIVMLSNITTNEHSVLGMCYEVWLKQHENLYLTEEEISCVAGKLFEDYGDTINSLYFDTDWRLVNDSEEAGEYRFTSFGVRDLDSEGNPWDDYGIAQDDNDDDEAPESVGGDWRLL